jgi:hypothetical protein
MTDQVKALDKLSWLLVALLLPAAAADLPPIPPLLNSKDLQTNRNLTFTLAWEAVTNVAGYNLYQGMASRAYTNQVSCPATAGSCTVNFLPKPWAPETFYFAVTAYDSNRLESFYSPEVTWTNPMLLTNRVITLFSNSLPIWTQTNPLGSSQLWTGRNLSISVKSQ